MVSPPWKRAAESNVEREFAISNEIAYGWSLWAFRAGPPPAEETVSLYRLDRVSSHRFDFVTGLQKMKANILTLVIALLGLSFLGDALGMNALWSCV